MKRYFSEDSKKFNFEAVTVSPQTGGVSFHCDWEFEKGKCPELGPGEQFDWQCDPSNGLRCFPKIYSG